MTPPPKPPISAEDRAEMRERCEKATPGPWTGSRNWTIVGPRHDWDRQWSADGCKSNEFDERICHVAGPGSLNNAKADYDFISRARTDLPALLDALAEADAALALERTRAESLRETMFKLLNTYDNLDMTAQDDQGRLSRAHMREAVRKARAALSPATASEPGKETR
jgi:hypothetical protein